MKIVAITETDNPNGVISLIEKLGPLKAGTIPNNSVTLQFADKYIYNSGLAILAAWRKHIGPDVSVVVDDAKCKETARRVITNSGLRSILEENVESPFISGNVHSKVPLQPIVPGFSTEKAIARVYKMFDDYAGYIRDTKPFRILLSEMVENSLVHGEIETPGYICAALHQSPTGDRCEISIVDSGIGIRASYMEGSNEEIKKRIHNGASPIEIALDGLSSSKPMAATPSGKSHFGFGLYTVRRLVELNRGKLTIASGNEAVTIDRFGKKRQPLSQTWHGTIVSILLDMANPLPLEDVYDEEVSRMVPAENEQTVIPIEPSTHAGNTHEPNEAQAADPTLMLSTFGAELLSREIGLSIRAEVATLLAGANRVVINLDNIEDITPSVADECFGKLAERLGVDVFRKRISFTGGTPLTHRLIDFVLAQRMKERK